MIYLGILYSKMNEFDQASKFYHQSLELVSDEQGTTKLRQEI
ncbi:tetratricopeptide repeat protein [Paenibacillus aceris]